MFVVVLHPVVPCVSSQNLSTKGQQSWKEEDDEEHEEGRVVVLMAMFMIQMMVMMDGNGSNSDGYDDALIATGAMPGLVHEVHEGPVIMLTVLSCGPCDDMSEVIITGPMPGIVYEVHLTPVMTWLYYHVPL